MYKEDSGLLVGDNTPTSLILAEVAHLNPDFNHKCKGKNGKEESIKLMAQQIVDTVTVQSASKYSQQSVLNFTNNGIYAAQKGVYHNVVQIDTHSQLPTFMYYLGLMDEGHKQMFLRKKQIERTPNYKDNPKLVKERADIKFQLNMYCSTNDTGKGRYVNRLLAMYSGMNFIFESMVHWGLSTIVDCVNDGYIAQTDPDEDFENEFRQFEDYWQQQFPLLTLSKKYWKHAIIKSPQDYILINTPADYKCRNDSLSVNGLYYQYTGKSLRTLKDDEVDKDALQIAQQKEQEAIAVLYNYMLRDNFDFDNMSAILDDEKEMINKSGALEAKFLPVKYHYYSCNLDMENSDQDKTYINNFTKDFIARRLFKTTETLKTRTNLLGQLIKVDEVNPDDFEKANRIMMIDNFVPCLIDPIKKGQSLESWVKYEAEMIERSDEQKLNQYNLLALTAQIYANEHGQNPNGVIKLINRLRTTKYLDRLDMAEILFNDPNTINVDGQIMVKDKHGVYTAKASVVNHLIKKHLDHLQKQHFLANKNNALALSEDIGFHNELETGFITSHQAVTFDEDGNIRIGSPYGDYFLSHYVDADYNPAIVNDPAYYLVNYFLKHLAPNQTKQLKSMLGLIALEGTEIMPEIRTFFVIKGVSGAGKSTLAKLLKITFDDKNQVGSNIVSSTQNVNKAFTDEHYIDLNDSRKGKLLLWFDDFQSSSKSNVITANAGTVINGALTGVSQTGAAKYEKEHAVKLPSLIVIATNAMPQVTQEGTAARMFVFDCPKTLKEDPIRDKQGNPVSVSDFLNNPKVKEALFYIIMTEASKILKMSEKKRAKLFDRKYSAATKLSQISDSFETFLEKENITSTYDLLGMQAIKLFDAYKEKMDTYNVSYRSFNDQLETLGLKLKRKHILGKNYQKVICADNDKLTHDKIKAMFNDLNVTPDCVEEWDSFKQVTKGSLKTWHHGYDQLKKKYPQSSEVFKSFDFGN